MTDSLALACEWCRRPLPPRESLGPREQLGRAQEATRGVAFGDDPDYAAAFDQLFTAVALLNPMYVAAEIANLGNECSGGHAGTVRALPGAHSTSRDLSLDSIPSHGIQLSHGRSLVGCGRPGSRDASPAALGSSVASNVPLAHHRGNDVGSHRVLRIRSVRAGPPRSPSGWWGLRH